MTNGCPLIDEGHVSYLWVYLFSVRIIIFVFVPLDIIQFGIFTDKFKKMFHLG